VISILGTGIFDARAGLSLAGGSIQSAAGTIEVGSAGGATAGNATVDAGNTLQGFGAILDPVIDNGTLLAQSGTLSLIGRVSGSGLVNIAPGGTVNATGRLSEHGMTFLAGSNETLILGTANALLAPTVSGFANTDVIDLAGVVANSESLVGSTLKLLEGVTRVGSITFAGSFSPTNFVLSSDVRGGTFITAAGLPTMFHQTFIAPHGLH
jgi:hypothetical protein